jgi:hypothetical protein
VDAVNGRRTLGRHVEMRRTAADPRAIFPGVRTDRSRMTVRIAPAGSPEAGDARMGGTVGERIAVVHELTVVGWALAKRKMPSYTRATMPVRVTTLAAQRDDDDLR